MKVSNIIGVDLAKNVFQLHGVDERGKTVMKKRLKRSEMAEFFAQQPSCRVVMEACGGANHWGRMLANQGHEPQLIAAQYVKAFKKTVQKNDRNDAEAIVEAALRPSMKYVAVKTLVNQDLQSLHRVRQLLIATRVMLSNQIRGLLMEYGVVMEKSFAKFKLQLPEVLEDASTELTPLVRELVSSQNNLLKRVTEELEAVDERLKFMMKDNDDCQRLMKVPGVGINGASMFMASIGDAKVFKNGRHVAAWLGLVPRQFSSGEIRRTTRITKAGDSPLRAMLINGARARVTATMRKDREDPTSQWIRRLHSEKGGNKTTVAVANKNVRIMFNILKYKTDYKKA
jgi:transposase